jgi:hypothetical protein
MEKLIEAKPWEGVKSPDNEFLVDIALAAPHARNLAHRDAHSMSQL